MIRPIPTRVTGFTVLILLRVAALLRLLGRGESPPPPPGEHRSHAPSCPARTRRHDAGHRRRGPGSSPPSPPPPERPPLPWCAPRASSLPRTPPSPVPIATRRLPPRSLPG